MNDAKKILVTGAAGNVGRAVAKALQAHGLNPLGGTTRPETAVLPAGIAAVRADYTDPSVMATALNGVDGLFLVAPPMDLEAPAKLNPVIDLAKELGVTKIVFNSALGVDQNEASPLRVIERHLMGSGLAHTILRPNFFMENFTTGFVAPMIAQGGIFLAADQAQTSFISTEDIAAVTVAAFTRDGVGSQYNLTGPEALDHEQVAAIISAASGRNIQYQALTEAAMLQGAREQGLPEGAVTYMSVLYNAVRSGWMATVTADVEEVLGRPPASFEAFARRNAASWR